jgi:hypothetical protein
MSVGYATIITPIRPSDVTALREYLRSDVEPPYDPDTVLKCNKFRFDRILSLHFCSFSILDEDAEFAASLIFEATFDGSREFFLDALLQLAPKQMDEIYQHCDGYPASGSGVPQLVKEYLAEHDVGAHAIFRGAPGRTVAQIKGEAHLREALAEYVSERWRSPRPMPSTLSGLQQELQQHAVHRRPANRWAEQMAAVPWEVATRELTIALSALIIPAAAFLLGVIVLGLCGLGPFHVAAAWPDFVRKLGDWLFRWSILHWVDGLGRALRITLSLPLLGLLVAWAVVRLLELSLQYDNPRQKLFGVSLFWPWALVTVLVTLRYVCLVAFAGFALLLLDKDSSLDPAFAKWLASLPRSTMLTAISLVSAGAVLLLLRHGMTTLKLKVQFEELTEAQENVRQLGIDILRVGVVLDVVFIFFIVEQYLLGWIELGPIVFWLVKTLVVIAAYVFVGLFIAYAAILAVLIAVRVQELRDRRRFASADKLTSMDNSSVFAREDGGINTYQNHLASLTYLKPGILRLWLLRVTLWFIDLRARFQFNVGDLSGIPTILSARWVIIDGGRRLLFLDTYSGAWDSYLNEFIDMGAVFGLNGIWTNTFVKVQDAEYGFPETEYYLWKGAQMERPFKAFVRQSQVETIVWYSAYPMPATVNINACTNLRQSLFKSLMPCEIDSILQDL